VQLSSLGALGAAIEYVRQNLLKTLGLQQTLLDVLRRLSSFSIGTVAVSACWGGLSIASVAPAAPAIDVIDPRRISKLTSLDGKPHMQSEGHRN
jgi:hypothetical protein